MHRCLIVEDDARNARYIADGLRELGYVVSVAGDGIDGLSRAMAEHWDVVVLDRMLPDDVDGLSIVSTLRGLGVLEVNPAALSRDLDDAWEVLAEPIQTVMRRVGTPDAYERLKELTRGAGITKEGIQAFIADLDLPDDDKQRLLRLTPATYTGLAAQLVRHVQPK